MNPSRYSNTHISKMASRLHRRRKRSGSTPIYRRRARCGGGVYLAVLGAAMIITVIGVSALLAVTVQRRISIATSEATAARFHAHAAIELALHQLANDSNWRTTYTNDTWANVDEMQGGSLQFKLIDDDGSLSDDPLDAVWLVGRGDVGQAVRITKVLLQPQRTLASSNIIQNGDAEAGTRHWEASGGAALAYLAAQPNNGAGCLVLRDRSSESDGVTQDLLGQLVSGQRYEVELWLRSTSGSNVFKVELCFDGVPTASVITAAIDTSWTRVSATLTPTVPALASTAQLKISTDAGTNDFLVDDVHITPEAAAHTMVPVPGTWQQAVQ